MIFAAVLRTPDTGEMSTAAVAVPGIPVPLTPSEDWGWDVSDQALTVSAKPRSDLFVDPSGDGGTAAESMMNAVSLTMPAPSADFTLSARVAVDFGATFDAGVLLVWIDERRWAKLCFEASPSGTPMVVSVVTRDVSDDANSFDVPTGDVSLRVSRVGRVYAFHASVDARTWSMVRAFALPAGDDDRVTVGFEAQSPMGEGCRVRFSDIAFEERTLADLRDGS